MIKGDEILKGWVKWFGTKGEAIGFIVSHLPSGERIEVMVHYSNILPDNQANPRFRTLNPRDKVEFRLAPGYYMDGTQAVDVRLLSNEHPG